jgi:hypothetical protein
MLQRHLDRQPSTTMCTVYCAVCCNTDTGWKLWNTNPVSIVSITWWIGWINIVIDRIVPSTREQEESVSQLIALHSQQSPK